MSCGNTPCSTASPSTFLSALQIPWPFVGWNRAAHRLLWLYERQQQRSRLLDLDGRLLVDIGLSRAEVEAEARKFFWQ